MKNRLTQILMAALITSLMAVPVVASAQDQQYQEGLHYFLIEDAPAQPEGIELVEAFSYLCTHCNTFEPYINSWVERKPEHVTFRRIPVVFGRSSWELYARGYVTAGLLGVNEEAHTALMDELWKEKNVLRSMDELAGFYSQFGVDKDKFISTSRSFAVDGKLRRDQLLLQNFGIRGTPALVLNGKYRIQGSNAVPNYDVMLDVVDFLIQQETAKQVASSAPQEAGE